ncbi:SPJ_0845 family protein [Vagococcus vulneris]|uniref:Uncharacterized protein n=1 Tax=Vagococcus vulneris TaxID=1977869 RepID=A0A429ZTA7_9ENTE|nr:SPJ_0845 family protein [Vagococcus vulneris]RST96916.1 hypothetical protein CBF37_10510 [Vagococcus vulneris]
MGLTYRKSDSLEKLFESFAVDPSTEKNEKEKSSKTDKKDDKQTHSFNVNTAQEKNKPNEK